MIPLLIRFLLTLGELLQKRIQKYLKKYEFFRFEYIEFKLFAAIFKFDAQYFWYYANEE